MRQFLRKCVGIFKVLISVNYTDVATQRCSVKNYAERLCKIQNLKKGGIVGVSL